MRAEADLVQDIGIPFEPGRAAARSSVPAVTAGLRFLFCALVLALGPMAWWQRHGWPVHRVIPASSFIARDGYSHSAPIPLYPFTRRLTDSVDRNETSDLRLFAGPAEIGPSHTPTDTITTKGGGAFDDWEDAVVMSAPDGGDPRTSGVVYSASYRAFPGPDALVALVIACALAALVVAEGAMLLDFRPWGRPDRWTAVQARHAGLTVALYAVALVVVAMSVHGVSLRTALAPSGVTAMDGLAFRAPLPDPPPLFNASSDDMAGGSRSGLTLTEDGRALGPAHAPHALIQSGGHGAFSHWAGGVVFSSGDGADPRTDGRSYEAAYRIFMVPTVSWSVLAICACMATVRLVGASGGTAFRLPREAVRGEPGVGSRTLPLPVSLLRLGGLGAVYTLALLILYGSLVAREHDTGGFKINFEYKVF